MNANARLIALINAKRRALFVGPPGCAKTARVAAAARSTGHELVVIRLSLAERVDLGGCLVPDTDKGVTRALPLDTLHRLRTATKPTLMFLDDLGQGPVDVQASAMSLFDAGALPDCVLIWGATNRPGDKAGVTSLCEPLRSRFHCAFAIATPDATPKADGPTYLASWKDEVDGWCEWACDEDFDPILIAWHRSTTGQHLYKWKPSADPALRMPDFRSWETVGHLMRAGLNDLDTIASAIGKSDAAQFLAFAALADQLPVPQQVWMDPEGAPVPTEPAAQYLIAAMLARAVEPKFAAQLVKYINRLPRVMGAYCAMDAFRRLGPRLTGIRAWQDWFVANQVLFTAQK